MIYVKSGRAEWVILRHKIRFVTESHQDVTVRAEAALRLSAILRKVRQERGYDNVDRNMTRKEAAALPMTGLRKFYGG